MKKIIKNVLIIIFWILLVLYVVSTIYKAALFDKLSKNLTAYAISTNYTYKIHAENYDENGNVEVDDEEFSRSMNYHKMIVNYNNVKYTYYDDFTTQIPQTYCIIEESLNGTPVEYYHYYEGESAVGGNPYDMTNGMIEKCCTLANVLNPFYIVTIKNENVKLKKNFNPEEGVDYVEYMINLKSGLTSGFIYYNNDKLVRKVEYSNYRYGVIKPSEVQLTAEMKEKIKERSSTFTLEDVYGSQR